MGNHVNYCQWNSKKVVRFFPNILIYIQFALKVTAGVQYMTTILTGGVSAIQLTLNVQLNESMAQGWTSVGLKVKVHDQ